MYLNAALKEIILCVAACNGMMETLYEANPEKLKPVRRYVKTIHTLTEKILEEAERGIDNDQLIQLLRWADNCQIVVVPKTDANANKKYVLVDEKEMERILKNTLAECATCLKGEEEVKRCQMRKDLLANGLMQRQKSRGICPFQP